MSDRPLLVLASRNAKKARELADLLATHGIQVRSVLDYPTAPEVDETGVTFGENACLKAATVARSLGEWTIADDSGLMVKALGGDPGVRSARYAGEQATDEENNQRLLQALQGVPPAQRGARFVCALAVADATGAIRLQVEDHCRGQMLTESHGFAGFGYDPLFLIPEYHRTFGELGLAVKSFLSHRARATRRLIHPLVALLTDTNASTTGNTADPRARPSTSTAPAAAAERPGLP